MSIPEYKDVTKNNGDHIEGTFHNTSAQANVVRNTDPALDISHEHHHGHLHHSAVAIKNREDEVSYSKRTTDEPSTTPRADIMDNSLHHRHKAEEPGSYSAKEIRVQDEEKGAMSAAASDEDPRHHALSNLYSRFRIFVHVFLFMLFTGLV